METQLENSFGDLGSKLSNFYRCKIRVQPLFLRFLKSFLSNTFKLRSYISISSGLRPVGNLGALQTMGPALLFITELDSPFIERLFPGFLKRTCFIFPNKIFKKQQYQSFPLPCFGLTRWLS